MGARVTSREESRSGQGQSGQVCPCPAGTLTRLPGDSVLESTRGPVLTPVGQGWLGGGHGGHVSPRTRGCGPGRCTHTRLAPVVGVGHTGALAYTRDGPLRPLHRAAGARGMVGDSLAAPWCAGRPSGVAPLLALLQEGRGAEFLLLWMGTCPETHHCQRSSAAGEAASSATWAGAGSGLATGGDLEEGGPSGAWRGPVASASLLLLLLLQRREAEHF